MFTQILYQGLKAKFGLLKVEMCSVIVHKGAEQATLKIKGVKKDGTPFELDDQNAKDPQRSKMFWNYLHPKCIKNSPGVDVSVIKMETNFKGTVDVSYTFGESPNLQTQILRMKE